MLSYSGASVFWVVPIFGFRIRWSRRYATWAKWWKVGCVIRVGIVLIFVFVNVKFGWSWSWFLDALLCRNGGKVGCVVCFRGFVGRESGLFGSGFEVGFQGWQPFLVLCVSSLRSYSLFGSFFS